jgi:serine/threonine protein kinase
VRLGRAFDETGRAYLRPGGQLALDGYREMNCPSCHRELRVRVGYVGCRVRCSYCRGVFGVSADAGSPGDPNVPQSGSADEVSASGSEAIRSIESGAPQDFAVPGYELLEVIADGAMGRVYKGRETRSGQVVAIKVLRESMARNPEYLRRFRREAEIAARLSHANIVHFLASGEVDGRPYIVMEFAEGRTVQSRLDRGTLFDEQSASAIALAVAKALDHARLRGLVHRDVKPANILLGPWGEVKLLDLGLARPVADVEWANAEAGNPIGTPEYISPEQVRGRVDVDIRTDIYALGATLYQMVTGRVPYSGTTVEILRQHVDSSTRPESPRRLNPRLGPGIEAVIEKMLAKDRDLRYASPDDLILDLRRVLVGERPEACRTDPSDATAPSL